MAIAPETCLKCHEDVVSPVEFGGSVHGQNGCTSCHMEVTSLEQHMAGNVMPTAPKCVRCHKQESADHFASVHQLNEVKCSDCHDDIHKHRSWKGDKNKAVAKCTGCHDDHQDYLDSVHGKAVAAGNRDSAACHDCHGLHRIEPLGDRQEPPQPRIPYQGLPEVSCRQGDDGAQRRIQRRRRHLHGELPRQELPARLPGQGCRLRRLPHLAHRADEGQPQIERQPRQPGGHLRPVPSERDALIFQVLLARRNDRPGQLSRSSTGPSSA